MDFNTMELNQVEAALMDQLDRLAQSDRRMVPGTFEADCVADAIRHTGSALTKVQILRHGEDDPDTEWGWAAALMPKDEVVPESVLRSMWGDR